MLYPSDPYLKETVKRLNSHKENLWENLDQVPYLSPDVSQAILGSFLEQACQCQHVSNITIGRYGILALPRDWVLGHIEKLAEPLVQLEDEWEYRRLLELYWTLDKELVWRLVQRGLKSSNSDLRKVSQEHLEKLVEQ